MLALIQLPNYLDRLEAGRADPPVILLPSINDLRVSRGTRPLKAAELLAPSPALVGQQTPTPEVLSSLASVVVKVRPHYHRYLLQVFQGEAGQGLVGLGRMFNQLHRFFDHGVFSDAFRAADAMVAGILSGGIPLNSATKALLGHVDTIFKPVLDPQPAWPGPQARHLIEEALAVLGGFEPASELVSDLDARYVKQAEIEAPPDLGESSRRSTLGVDALGSLAEEVLRELAGIEDRLDLFVRGGAEDPGQLTIVSTAEQFAAAVEGYNRIGLHATGPVGLEHFAVTYGDGLTDDQRTVVDAQPAGTAASSTYPISPAPSAAPMARMPEPQP